MTYLPKEYQTITLAAVFRREYREQSQNQEICWENTAELQKFQKRPNGGPVRPGDSNVGGGEGGKAVGI